MMQMLQIPNTNCSATAAVYRIAESKGTNLSIKLHDIWQSIVGGVMLGSNRSVPVSANMLEYLKYEANRRHISIEEAYWEEMDGQERARQTTLTREQLRRLAAATQPDKRLLEGDEKCPF